MKSCVLSSNALDFATAGSRSILGGTDWDKAADALETAAEPESYVGWMLDDARCTAVSINAFCKCLLKGS